MGISYKSLVLSAYPNAYLLYDTAASEDPLFSLRNRPYVIIIGIYPGSNIIKINWREWKLKSFYDSTSNWNTFQLISNWSINPYSAWKNAYDNMVADILKLMEE